MNKEADLLEAEAALARVLARYRHIFWDTDEKILNEALAVLRKEASK